MFAPDLVEAILEGWVDQRVMLDRLERPLPVAWEEQRSAWGEATPARSADERSFAWRAAVPPIRRLSL